jgi:hypothetical protein
VTPEERLAELGVARTALGHMVTPLKVPVMIGFRAELDG